MPEIETTGHEIVVAQPRMITPAGSIGEAVEQFKLYQELKKELGTEDDFVVIGKKKHPMKSFVRKVQRFFTLSCEIIEDEAIRDEDGVIVGWKVTARATHQPTGSYQDGDGSCEFKEKAERQRTIHNIRAHAVTRAKNRAILDLVGFGEVSAEEIIDDKQGRESKSRPDNRPITKAQQKELWRRAKTLDWSPMSNPEDGLRHVVAEVKGVDPEAVELGKITRAELTVIAKKLSEFPELTTEEETAEATEGSE